MDRVDMLSHDPVYAKPSFEDDLKSARQLAAEGRLDEALRIWTDLREQYPDRRQPYLDAATHLRQQRRMEEAEAWLDQGQQHFADDLGFSIERSWLAYHRRDMPEAIRRWQELCRKFPTQAFGTVGLAVSLRDDGRPQEAEALLANARTTFPKDASISIEYAWLASRRRDWPEATARWQQVRADFPDHSTGYVVGATCLRESGRAEEAEALLTQAIVRFPEDVAAAVEFAQLAHHRKDWPEAHARWQRVRNRFPDARDGYLLAARTLQAANEPEKSCALLAEAERHWPNSRDLLDTAAHLAYERGDSNEAIRLGREMMRLFPGVAMGTFHTVRALRDTGQVREAEDLLGNVLQAHPNDAAILSIWASLAMLRSDWPEAMQRWALLRNRFPDDGKFTWQYANVLWRIGHDRDADALLDQASAHFPKDTAVQSMWIEAAMRRKDWPVAHQRAATVRERVPDLAAGYILGARALRLSGQEESAEHLMSQARRVLPHEPAVRRADAEDAMARQDWTAAERLWTAFRAAHPKDIAGYLGGASSLNEAGRFALADGMMQKTLALFPSSLVAHVVSATMAQRRQDHNEAIRRWERVRLLFPDAEAGYGGGSRALHEAGRTDDADALMGETVRRFPGDPDAALRWARFAATRADHKAAEARFRSAVQRFPLRSEALIGLAEALSEIDRQSEAESVLADGLQRFSDDQAVFAAYAAAASRRLDWNEALRRWTETSRRFPQEPVVAQRIFEVRLRLAETTSDPANHIPEPESVAEESDTAKLVKRFESLGGAGHGCEFGLFQRHFGAEPLGLLRWADLGHELLTQALESEFEGVGDPEHTELFTPPADRPEYWTRDRRYWMAMRCFIPADQVPYEKMFAQACRRLQYLRRKLIEDLRLDEKIFVFKCLRQNLSDADLALLHAAVRRYGRNTLLYVRYEEPDHPNGTVRVLANGLMVGYVDRFGFSAQEENLGPAIDSWAGVCRAAYDLYIRGETERSVDHSLAVPPAEQPLDVRPIEQTKAADGPVVSVKWSDGLRSRLNGEAAKWNADTREAAFANIRLDVALGDLQAARQRIADVQSRFAVLYPHDGYTFESLVVSAILASQWDLVQRFVNDRFGKQWCSGVTAERLEGGGQTIRWELDADGSCRFIFDTAVIERDRAWDELVQFVRTLSLFHDYATYAYAEQGSVRVNLGDAGAVPGLAFCDFRPGYFLVPDSVFLNTNGYEALRNEIDANLLPWGQRVAKAFWRGATTGQRRGDWRGLPRVQLCLMAKAAGDLIDAGLTGIVGMPPEMVAEAMSADISRPFVKPVDFMKFKYQLDVDGNTNAWAALFQKLYTGSPVLKVASPLGFRQWFYDDLKPWWNYVPVAADMSDLIDKIKWLQAHDLEARRIGERGRTLAMAMTHRSELTKARRVVSAALRHFSGRKEVLIRLGRDDADALSMLDGWSDIVDGGRWAIGPEARLQVRRSMAEGPFMLRLTVAPGCPGGAGQRMIIAIDGEVVHQCQITEAGVVECAVPSEQRFNRDSLLITLLLPDTMTTASACVAGYASSLQFRAIELIPAAS